MPVLCDFAEIVGNEPIQIGDSRHHFQQEFHTGGRIASRPCFLIFNVKHLTHTETPVEISINGNRVGEIQPYFPGGDGISSSDDQPEKWRQAPHWYTQMIAFNGQEIRRGKNRIDIDAVELPNPGERNKYDDFQIKNMMCFFHQDD